MTERDVEIRRATERDIAGVLELGALIVLESPTFRGDAWSPSRAEHTIRCSMGEGGAFVAVSASGQVVGAVLGWVDDHHFTDTRVAGEYATMLLPEWRRGWAGVRLLRAWARWALEAGADRLVVAESSGIKSKRVRAMLVRLGLEPSGSSMRFSSP